MVNRSKRKGTDFETDVVEYLVEHGFPYAERRAQHGNQDRGDIAGVPGWTLECKALAKIDLAGACTEAQKERENTGTPWWAAIIKRRGKPTRNAYVVMDLEQFVRLIGED